MILRLPIALLLLAAPLASAEFIFLKPHLPEPGTTVRILTKSSSQEGTITVTEGACRSKRALMESPAALAFLSMGVLQRSKIRIETRVLHRHQILLNGIALAVGKAPVKR